MLEKLLAKIKIPRLVEFFSGVILATLLVARYYDSTGRGRSLLWFLLPWDPLLIFVTIFLFVLAARLIAGKPKDYSKLFFRLMVKIFGNPQKNT